MEVPETAVPQMAGYKWFEHPGLFQPASAPLTNHVFAYFWITRDAAEAELSRLQQPETPLSAMGHVTDETSIFCTVYAATLGLRSEIKPPSLRLN